MCPAGLAVCLVVTPDRALRLPGLFIAPAGSVSWILFTHGIYFMFQADTNKLSDDDDQLAVAGVP